jgi:hypothetical protein
MNFFIFVDIRLPQDEDDLEKEAILSKMKEGMDETPSFGKDGLDSEYNRRMQDKLGKMKGKKMQDMSIIVTQKLPQRVPSRERRSADSDRVKGQGRVREELVRRQGSIEYTTDDQDGTVNICVQSIVASKENPQRIHVNVVVDEDTAGDAYEEEPEKTSEAMIQQAGEVKKTMTRLEKDMHSLTNRVKTIINSADFNKEQEVGFHDQSIAMNRAASYWPIIRIVFLFVTGFAQVNHIVGFMKTHHIS